MRLLHRVCGAFVVGMVVLAAAEAHAGRWWCRGPMVVPACGPAVSYSSCSYSGYWSASSWSGWGWGGGWRAAGWGRACGSRPVCAGWSAPGFQWGTPCWGGGWFGGPAWRSEDSVFLSVPAGGGATFFSGALVPTRVWGWGYPTNWAPGWQACPGGFFWTPYAVPLPAGVGPQFGPAGVLPFMGLSSVAPAGRQAAGQAVVRAGNGAPRPVIAAAKAGGRALAMRASSPAARVRAARLVAVGDRHLRAAAGDPAQAAPAADAYRRAAAIAPDQPDIHVRHAVALVALGRAAQADDALAKAVAVDGRLADRVAAAGDGPPDPVFGDRAAGEPTPLAARGAAILREIGSGDQADRPGLGRMAELWARRWEAPGAAVAIR